MDSFFGTDGIRASIGTSFFTHETLPPVAHAIGRWITTTYARENVHPRTLIIHDTRNSCAYIKAACKTVFLAMGIDVFDAGVLPTPAAAFLIKKNGYDCALIISASHNPWYDNGIKIMDGSGKLSPQAEQMMSTYIMNPVPLQIDYRNLGQEKIVDGIQEYHDVLIPFFEKNFLQGKKIVLDCANGATSAIAPEMFAHFGAEVIPLNQQPDGFNINLACGSLAPEQLKQAVLHHQADMGFAFDGDGDRVLMMNKEGVLKNGDDILALLSQHPDYVQQTTIVGTIMSNLGLEAWLTAQNKKFIRTAVGDKYVVQALNTHQALLGGERSGHIVLKNYTHTGDGLLVALKIAETLLLLNNPMAQTFTPFPQVLLTVPVKKICNLAENPYDGLIQQAEKLIPSGRISVRYSGTEKNMLRIMVESELFHDAHTIAHHLAHSLQKELS